LYYSYCDTEVGMLKMQQWKWKYGEKTVGVENDDGRVTECRRL